MPCRHYASSNSGYCSRHQYQSSHYQAGNVRSASSAPPLSAQASFDLFDDIEATEEPPVASAIALPAENYPRYAIFRGRKIRILHYEGDNRFRILDTDDTSRTLHRNDMTFIAEKKKKQPKLV
jgi:hypothetical protein